MAGTSSVNLSGNVESKAGSSGDNGNFTATCGVDGSSQLTLQLSSGTHKETRSISAGVSQGAWSDPEGNLHSISSFNLSAPASWFCPGITLAQIVSRPDAQIEFIGLEEKNGANLAHFRYAEAVSAPTTVRDEIARLSTVEIYLDPQSTLPAVFDFNLHPDNDSSTDIPIEVRFSNYTKMNGISAPMSIEQYINSSLALTMTVQATSPTPVISAN
jgi:hypothetical protein